MTRPLIGLLRAATDPRLLGVIELWPRQRELLAGVEAGPRMHIQALGRRSSKTTMAALVALWQLLFRPDLDAMVRSGETRYAVCVATNLKTARLLIAAARSIVEASPTCAPLLESHDLDELRFRLPDGSRTALRAVPCNARGIRGMPISCLVFDELAFFMSDTDGPAVAEQIAQALIRRLPSSGTRRVSWRSQRRTEPTGCSRTGSRRRAPGSCRTRSRCRRRRRRSTRRSTRRS